MKSKPLARRESLDLTVRVLASVVIQRGNKVLLINEQDEPYNGQWVIPGGYVKRNEEVKDAARREVREELGIEVELEALIGVYDDFTQGASPVHYVIVAYAGRFRGSAEPFPTAEAIDHAWVDVSKIPPPVPSVVRRILRDLALRNGKRSRPDW